MPQVFIRQWWKLNFFFKELMVIYFIIYLSIKIIYIRTMYVYGKCWSLISVTYRCSINIQMQTLFLELLKLISIIILDVFHQFGFYTGKLASL